MNIPLNRRMQDVINRIVNRENRPVRQNQPVAPQRPVLRTVDNYVFKKQTIPKSPIYYKELADQSEGYIKSVFLRARTLALQNKHREINTLFETANETIKRQRNRPNEPAPARPRARRQPRQTRYNLRPSTLRNQDNIKNLNQFVIDYLSKIKHKKQNYLTFLQKMYNGDKNYLAKSRKFAKIRRNMRNRA